MATTPAGLGEAEAAALFATVSPPPGTTKHRAAYGSRNQLELPKAVLGDAEEVFYQLRLLAEPRGPVRRGMDR